ncbi:MAG TPA: hypothetical protein DG754_04985 [Bacteroidales bacterium]|nr:hypothetical protein [Bacteroidales bacterium]
MFLIRFVFIFFLIIFLLGYVFRLFAGVFLKRFQNKYGGGQNQKQQRAEGDVYVSKTAQKEKIVDKDVGDYVDYEEVDE